MRRVGALLALAVLLSACSSHELTFSSDSQSAYAAALHADTSGYGVNVIPDKDSLIIGEHICNDFAAGKSAVSVSQDRMSQFPVGAWFMLMYYSTQDLCPQYHATFESWAQVFQQAG